LQPNSRLLSLAFKRSPRLLCLTLQLYLLKFGSNKFNIIINLKNIILFIKNIIIINIIINKFEKILLILKNNHRFDLRDKDNYYYYYFRY
jgi:hypothetical protein